jgi:hypothetical protein
MPETGPSAVEIDIRPKRATVFLDGENIGRAKEYNGTWNLLWLEPGVYELEFAYDGYRTLRTHLRVRSGRWYRFTDRMEKGEGLDPRSTAEPPPEPVPEAARTTDPHPGETAPPDTGLQRGLLRIRVLPKDAAVYLDGDFLARAGELTRLHGALPVAVGIHRIEVVRPGFRSEVTEVRVSEDDPAIVELTLERE